MILTESIKNPGSIGPDAPLSAAIPLEILTELGQATTAYHEAPPEHVARAREEYQSALRKLQSWQPALK